MKKFLVAGLVALFGLGLWSCDQNETLTPDAVETLDGARLTGDSTGFHYRDTLTRVDVSALPATITSFISTSYVGATINYAATDDDGNFLVAITVGDDRKALLFNADGTFNRELSVRGRGRGHGRGHGRGRDRDSLTTVAVASLPAAITSYITTNYAGATVTKAALDSTRGYFVQITLNSNRQTLLFNADGTFAQEITRRAGRNYTAIEVSALPATVTSYITTNYAGATIVAAGTSSTGQFKVIIQPTTGRSVALLFAADGTFVQVLRKRR